MSIRIHELAKRYNMKSKDRLALLKERSYVAADTKSVSSEESRAGRRETKRPENSRQPGWGKKEAGDEEERGDAEQEGTQVTVG